MTKQPSEAAKVRACELANAAGGWNSPPYQSELCHKTRFPSLLAFALFIDEVSEAAKVVHSAMDGQAWSLAQYRGTLATFILPDPVDPLLIEAREIVANADVTRTFNQTQAIRDGRAAERQVEVAMAALKRGMELAQEQSQ